ncbi:uncharacterized protein ACHE_11834A [Aspergillus chevalieri]|uniref:Uncharacterized protein n=1 Tax=Aspergillus chevalieri TaxID=182096 RepID=A0A7R7VGQ0_ASPCH|nr:uncharacterized protein ACHE_11834A [Aspergillus chevalieri]BCR84432.1 hypothetical protein ACHE_11834A [Aspergillus chevalieri]
MVNWRAADAKDRLFASLLASHPTLKLDYHTMTAIYGEGATYDAVEKQFRRYRKMANDLRTGAQARGVNIDGPVPRTPRGSRNRASGLASASASKSKSNSSAAKNKKGIEDSTVPETPTKANSRLGNTMGSAADVICLDDSASPEVKTKKEVEEAESLFVKMENVNPEHTATRSPSLPVLSRVTPPPVKPKSLIIGSVTPLKRSVEGIEESPTPRVKAEGRREMTKPFAFGIGDSFTMSDPFVNEDYYEGAA